MKRHLLSAVSFSAVSIASSAWAADVMPESVYNWTGFYVGGQIGASTGTLEVGPVDVLDGLDDVSAKGDLTQTLAGIHAGYNHQLNSIVLGVETDINAGFGEGTMRVGRLRTLSDWNASLRARAGLLVTPRSLLYATGGVAYGDFETKRVTFESDFPEPESDLLGGGRWGWTVGGGWEYALDHHWRTRLEYRYTDWGTDSVRFNSEDEEVPTSEKVDSDYFDHRFVIGLSYLLGGGQAGDEASVDPDYVYDWTGFYLGGHMGAGAGQMKVSGEDEFGTIRANGGYNQMIVGGHAGYNYQFGGGLLIGIEGDLDYREGGGWLSFANSYPSAKWEASVRGRVGFSPTARSLIYGTGGVAFGDFETRLHEIDPPDESKTLDKQRTGWTVGGGLEYALDGNWSTRIEYRYTDWGTKHHNILPNEDDPVQGESKLRDSSVRMGLTYKLGESGTFADDDSGPFEWTGFRVGGQVGATGADFTYTDLDETDDEEYADFAQILGGGHLGYDYQFSAIVVGIEADINGKTGHGFKFDDQLRPTSNWDGSVRGRLGLALTDRSLIYATGGYAFGHFSTPQSGAGEPEDPAEEHLGGNHDGWTIGGGINYALSESWSTGIEYRYTDWGKERADNLTDFNCGDGCPERAESDLDESRVIASFSYHFEM
jgi:outer membrane immunogenic protein